MHVKGCFHRASTVTYERRPECIAFSTRPPDPCSTRPYAPRDWRRNSEGRPFLHVRQHGRLTHPEPAVLSTSAPTVGEHHHKRVLVDVVVSFAQSFGAVFVSGSKTIVRLASQPHKPVSGPFHHEQTRCPLIVRPARFTARLVADSRSICESTVHVLVPMVVATFGEVSEVVFS